MRRHSPPRLPDPRPAVCGHVRLTDAAVTPPHSAWTPPATGPGDWCIQDATGRRVAGGFHDRAEALRTLGLAALGGAELPLSVVDPEGHATGDRLAG